MTARLNRDAFIRRDDEDRRVDFRGAAEHVAYELAMSGGVDEYEVASGGPQPDARDVQRDRLIALELERIQQKRILDRDAALGAHRFELGELLGDDLFQVDHQAAEDRRLTGIDVTDHYDAKLAHMYPEARKRSKVSSLSWSIARPARSG